MAFTKIKETVAAFESDSPDFSRKEHLSKASTKIKKLQSGREKPNKAVNIGVYVFIVLPCIFLLYLLWNNLFPKVSSVALTVISSSVLTYIYSHFEAEIFNKIPFYKLNPYVGNTLEETVDAFRKEEQEEKTMEMFEGV